MRCLAIAEKSDSTLCEAFMPRVHVALKYERTHFSHFDTRARMNSITCRRFVLVVVPTSLSPASACMTNAMQYLSSSVVSHFCRRYNDLSARDCHVSLPKNPNVSAKFLSNMCQQHRIVFAFGMISPGAVRESITLVSADSESLINVSTRCKI